MLLLSVKFQLLMKETVNKDPDKYLNTNEMINDYAFMYQVVIEQKPMDFEAMC